MIKLAKMRFGRVKEKILKPDIQWFKNARYGMIIHYGVYSLLGRGEWVLNREEIPVEEYKGLAKEFTADKFDADDLMRRARDWGMRYAVFTCKHHDGFCLYDSRLTDFTAPKSACGRDLVAEFVHACRKHGIKIGLYHSLNDLTVSPNAVDALERPDECYEPFIDFVHGQIREIMTNYGKIDVMWYDGWWPFDASGWQAEKLNAMVRKLQPGILVNGRCGLKGDFETPEGHIHSFRTPWEACMTLNNNWGYHRGDDNWKSPKTVTEMLRKCASGCGNLLLNVGPKGDGSIPEKTIEVLDEVGRWLKKNGEAIYDTDRFECYLRRRLDGRADWTHNGLFSASGNSFYLHVVNWPGSELVICGVESRIEEVSFLPAAENLNFSQADGRVIVKNLPQELDTSMPVVIRFRCDSPPSIYKCGGLRTPAAPHCRYDPLPSDVLE